MFNNHFITNFFTECSSEKILKIGHYLTKIWTKFCGLLFWLPCIFADKHLQGSSGCMVGLPISYPSVLWRILGISHEIDAL